MGKNAVAGIIDLGLGNTGSVLNMVKRVGGQGVLCRDAVQIRGVEKLILPGVGSFDQGMDRLDRSGLVPALHRKVLEQETPILGICLGMQLMTHGSEEGAQSGLSWINGQVEKFRSRDGNRDFKIPHMGWNTVKAVRKDSLLEGLGDGARFYFVHSYHVVCREPEDILAVTLYGSEFVSSVRRGNLYGVQFHPEKSHKFGMKLLRNFLES